MAGSCTRVLAAATVALLWAGHAGAAVPCYRNYDGAGKLIYEGRRPPFDVSSSSAELAESRRRGEHLVWFKSAACGEPIEGRVAGPTTEAGRPSTDAVILNRAPESFYGRRRY